MNILCRLGIHDWAYNQDDVMKSTRRICRRCRLMEGRELNEWRWKRVRQQAYSPLAKRWVILQGNDPKWEEPII